MSPAGQHTGASLAGDDLVGFRVGSVGGPGGKVDAATREANDRYLVIKTGRWPFRRRVVVPAGAINCVDPQRHRLWVERDRDEIGNAPAFDQIRHGRPASAVRHGRPASADGRPGTR